MAWSMLLVSSLLAGYVLSQQIGTTTPEVHPVLTSYKCTTAGGCTAVNTSVTIDQAHRTLHKVGSTTNCLPSGFDTSICTSVTTCGENCALEGVNYAANGITTSGASLTLNLYKTTNGVASEISPRAYLLANNSTYALFKLLNQEFSFDVDTSKVPCAINGALYLSEMAANGSSSVINTAGAGYGTGYCDAQCPALNFVLGKANLNSASGACCAEMDLWEANDASNALTPHACSITGPYACTGTCSVCDKNGCDYNPYRMGNPSFYGPSLTVDTTKNFTVVTQFITSDGTATGTLSKISRIYIQDGKVIQNANVSIPGMTVQNTINTAYCKSKTSVLGETDNFDSLGGMAGIGGALGRGMVLAFSIWEGGGTGMEWLDGVYPAGGNASAPGVKRGNCPANSGTLASLYPNAAVTFSDIRVGDIGSTYSALGV